MPQKKKKILISVTNDLSNEYRMHKTALWLIEQGFEVEIIGRKKKNSPKLPKTPYKANRLVLPFEKGVWFYASYNLTLFFVLLFLRYDILLSVDLDTLLSNFLASKIRKKRLIYDSHEYFTELPELVHRPKVKKVWYWIEKWIFPKLKYVYTVSHSIAQEYQQKYGVDVKVVRNIPQLSLIQESIPLHVANLQRKYGKKILLYQGAVNIGRGLEAIIDAIPELDYVLVILGNGDILDELKQQVAQKNLTDKVHFLGHISLSDLPYYTAQARIGLCLLDKNMGKSYQYALPNKLFEYLYAGIPVLATSMTEIKQFIDTYKVGKYINNHQVRDIKEGIEEIEKNYSFYVQNCKETQKKISWVEELSKVKMFFE